eukprot:TRINITY_DN14804_c0_g1_i1.p1 TRINITY_DN14804_c0_g1~~TRINITY_DN14804_c0_g1_i1.p1  ORF type:complete len:788 (+),score=205.90 TRINITY_DN14804_c0_g1_i1:95-2458(+)
MIRRPPRSTLSSSSAASDVYKRQEYGGLIDRFTMGNGQGSRQPAQAHPLHTAAAAGNLDGVKHILDQSDDAAAALRMTSPEGGDAKNALSWACESGQHEMVDWLLGAKADPNGRNVTGTSALHLAATKGHTTIARALGERGAEVNLLSRDNNTGATPLMEAIRAQHADTVEALLDMRASATACRPDGTQCIHIACMAQDSSIVQKLLEAKADIAARNDHGITPLLCACQRGRPSVAQLLVSARADVNRTGPQGVFGLSLASHGGFTEVVQVLLDAKADQGMTTPPNSETCLDKAVKAGHGSVVELLLPAAGIASVPLKSLQHAIFKKHHEVVRALVAAKIDVNARVESTGETAFSLAFLTQEVPMVKILLTAEEVELNEVKVGDDGSNPIVHCADKNLNEIAEVLLAHPSVDPSFTSHHNQTTALQIAAAKNNLELVRMLLGSLRISVDRQDQSGFSALHAAAQAGHTEIVNALTQAGAGLETVTVAGHTALMMASEAGQLGVVQALLEARAGVNAVAADGCTALFAAAEGGRVACCAALLEHNPDTTLKVTACYGRPIDAFGVAQAAGHADVVSILQDQPHSERELTDLPNEELEKIKSTLTVFSGVVAKAMDQMGLKEMEEELVGREELVRIMTSALEAVVAELQQTEHSLDDRLVETVSECAVRNLEHMATKAFECIAPAQNISQHQIGEVVQAAAQIRSLSDLQEQEVHRLVLTCFELVPHKEELLSRDEALLLMQSVLGLMLQMVESSMELAQTGLMAAVGLLPAGMPSPSTSSPAGSSEDG